MRKKNNKKEDHETTGNIRRGYSNVDFDSLVNEALGLISEEEEKMEKERKNMKGIEQDLIKMMHNGEWAKISEFRYRFLHLRLWVDELEYRYWSQKDVVNSHWQQ